MLVLSRRLNERLIINDNIIITVVDIKRDRVRIGVTAPSDIRVDREEVAARIKALENGANPDGPLPNRRRP